MSRNWIIVATVLAAVFAIASAVGQVKRVFAVASNSIRIEDPVVQAHGPTFPPDPWEDTAGKPKFA